MVINAASFICPLSSDLRKHFRDTQDMYADAWEMCTFPEKMAFSKKWPLSSECVTSLRYQLLRFRLDLYASIRATISKFGNPTLAPPIKFYNIWLLYYLPHTPPRVVVPNENQVDFELRFLWDRSQLVRTITSLNFGETESPKKDFLERPYGVSDPNNLAKGGLARLAMLQARRNDPSQRGVDTYLFHHWLEHPVYSDESVFGGRYAAEDLEHECKVYGLDSGRHTNSPTRSTVIAGVADRLLECFLIFDRELDPDDDVDSEIVRSVVPLVRRGLAALATVLRWDWRLLKTDQAIYDHYLTSNSSSSTSLRRLLSKTRLTNAQLGPVHALEILTLMKRIMDEVSEELGKDADAQGALDGVLNSLAAVERMISDRGWVDILVGRGKKGPSGLGGETKKFMSEVKYLTPKSRNKDWPNPEDLSSTFWASHGSEHVRKVIWETQPVFETLARELDSGGAQPIEVDRFLYPACLAYYSHDIGMGTSYVRTEGDGAGEWKEEAVRDLLRIRTIHSILSADKVLNTNQRAFRRIWDEERNDDIQERAQVALIVAYHVRKMPLCKSGIEVIRKRGGNVLTLNDVTSSLRLRQSALLVGGSFNKTKEVLFCKGNGEGSTRVRTLDEIAKSYDQEDWNPVFFFTAILRLADSFDVGIHRLFGRDAEQKAVTYAALASHKAALVKENCARFRRLLKDTPLHLLKHASILNWQLEIEAPPKDAAKQEDLNALTLKILYCPEIFIPFVCIVEAWASIQSEINSEVEFVNHSVVLTRMKEECVAMGANMLGACIGNGIHVAVSIEGSWGAAAGDDDLQEGADCE